MLNKLKKIVFIIVTFSLFVVEASASQKLSKKQLDAFLVIVTNYIMDDVVDKKAPVFLTSASITASENQTNAYRVRVRDISSVRFSLSGGDSRYFNINASSGFITFKHAPDFETRDTYGFTVKATDSQGNSSTQSVTIHIRNLPEVGKPKKTMQRIKYRTGDDGYYQKGITPSYTRNDATGVVTDHVTGFQWQDNVNRYEVHYKDAVNYCKNLGLDGGGWRLPTVRELLTIVVRGKQNPALDSTVFKYYVNDDNYDYWATSNWYSWKVNFNSGTATHYFEADCVRCVR